MRSMLIHPSFVCRISLLLFLWSLCFMPSLQAQEGSGSFTPLSGIPGLDPNEQAIGRAIEVLCPKLSPQATGATGDLQIRCTELIGNALGGNQDVLRNPLLQMTSKEVSSQGTSSIETSSMQFTNIGARIAALRRGMTGISVMGLALRDGERTPPSTAVASLWPTPDATPAGDADLRPILPRFASTFAGTPSLPTLAQAQSTAAASAAEPNPFGRLGIFVNGTFAFGDKDTTSREAGFDFDTYGVTGGADYRFTDNFILGLAFGYSSTDADFASARGNLDVGAYTFSAFGTYYLDKLYFDGIFSYGWNDYDSTRNIVYTIPSTDRLGNPIPGTTTVNQTSRTETDGSQYALSFSAGYDFSAKGFTFGPYGRINYLKADIDAFQERINNTNPGSGLSLAIDEQDVESFTWVLGGQGSYALSTGFGVLVPQVRFEWEHEFLNDRRTVTATVISDPANTPIFLETDQPDRDYFNLGAGVSAVFQRNVAAFVYYETVLALQDVTAHKIAVGVRLAF
jgi:outer membrane autotransporter protein